MEGQFVVFSTQEEVVPYYEAYSLLSHMLESSPHKVKFMLNYKLTLNLLVSFKQMSHRLKPGEVFTFNNRRIVHARTKVNLNGGKRLFQVKVKKLVLQFLLIN